VLEKTLNAEIESKHKDCDDLRAELKTTREELAALKLQTRSGGSPSQGSSAAPANPEDWEEVNLLHGASSGRRGSQSDGRQGSVGSSSRPSSRPSTPPLGAQRGHVGMSSSPAREEAALHDSRCGGLPPGDPRWDAVQEQLREADTLRQKYATLQEEVDTAKEAYRKGSQDLQQQLMRVNENKKVEGTRAAAVKAELTQLMADTAELRAHYERVTAERDEAMQQVVTLRATVAEQFAELSNARAASSPIRQPAQQSEQPHWYNVAGQISPGVQPAASPPAASPQQAAPPQQSSPAALQGTVPARMERMPSSFSGLEELLGASEESQWSCKHCTFLNAPEISECEMCGQGKE